MCLLPSRKLLLGIVGGLWLLLLCGISGAQAVLSDPAALITTRIVPGYELAVTVKDEDELTGRYVVAANGNIRLRLTDSKGKTADELDIEVGGKTAEEARDLLNERLKKFLRRPDVSVVIAKMPRLRIVLAGPVKGAGPHDLLPGARLTDALALCRAAPRLDFAHVLILRREKDDTLAMPRRRAIEIDFSDFLKGDSEDDPALENGDKIVLTLLPEPKPDPVTTFAHIRGEVDRECDIPVGPGMSLKDALDKAGGLKPTADKEHLRLIRRDGSLRELNADAILANSPNDNLTLLPGDTLDINRKAAPRRFMVTGEVAHAGTFEIQPGEHITIIDALRRAGGPTKNADQREGILSKSYITDLSHAREIHFSLEKMQKGKQRIFEVEEGDAVVMLKKKNKPSLFQQLLPLALHFLPFGL